LLINKEKENYGINNWNVNALIVLSTFAILLLYLSSTFHFDNIKQVWADSVIATIHVGTSPSDVAYDSHDRRMYVTNYFDNSVSVIDTKTNKVNATIVVGTSPRGVAYDSVYNKVYVVNSGSDSVSVIDTS
jgi:YVTN family beta-propeller protein